MEGGAIASFVSIATNKLGALRSIAIQALRVMSEDVSPSRRTQLQLCEHSAAMALGTTLKYNVAILVDVLVDVLRHGGDVSTPELKGSLQDLHEALCALANVLDLSHDGDANNLNRTFSTSSFKEPHLLIKGCLDTANSGGLEALLTIASTQCDLGSTRHNMSLLEEACRSLACMSPLLLTSKVAAEGYAKWAHDILCVFHHVLRQRSGFGWIYGCSLDAWFYQQFVCWRVR